MHTIQFSVMELVKSAILPRLGGFDTLLYEVQKHKALHLLKRHELRIVSTGTLLPLLKMSKQLIENIAQETH